MKSFDTEFKKYSDKVRLTASERNELHGRLSSYMEYHPISKGVEKDVVSHSVLAGESFAVLRFSRRAAQLAVGLFVLTLIVIPFAAEKSVPGEVLYLVKTGINEPIQGQFATSPYEKIKFETTLVERRIAEARALADEGKLTDQVQNQLAETVKTHTQNVTNQIAELRTKDADGAAIAQIAFDSSLEVQSALLGAKGGVNDSSVGTMLTAVSEARVAISPTATETPSYDALLAQVNSETTKARTLADTIKKSASPDDARDIDRRLSDIDRMVGEVTAAHNTQPATTSQAGADATTTTLNDSENASTTAVATTTQNGTELSKLISALQLAQKLNAFMTDITVRKAVTLDTLVPVVLSDGERIAGAQDAMITLSERIEHLKEAVADVKSPGLAGKISLGIKHCDELSDKITHAITAADPATSDAALTELKALVSDLEAMVEAQRPVTEDGAEDDAVGDGSASSTSQNTGTTTPAA